MVHSPREKPVITQLMDKFLAFYEKINFISAFTRILDRHFNLRNSHCQT